MASEIRCSKCGTMNRPDANYCKSCHTPFGGEWRKQKDEFARYIPAHEYAQGGQETVIIPYGSRGMIFENGRLVESIESGKYSLKQDNFFVRLLKGSRSYSVIVLDAGTVSLGFNFRKLRTKDNKSVDLSIEIEFGCGNPSLFFINLMKNNPSFKIDDFRPLFFSELKNILASNLKRYNFQDLDTGRAFKDELGSYIAAELRSTCRNNGLDLHQVKSVSFTQEFMEKIMDQMEAIDQGWQEIEVGERQGQLDAARTDSEVRKMEGRTQRTKELGDRAIAHDLVRADLVKERVAVLKRLQEADVEKIKTREDFRKFQLEIDRDKALDQAEWDEFERELVWKKEDQVRDRQFLTRKIELQQSHELRRLELLEDKALSIEEKNAQYEILDLELKNELRLEFERMEGLARIKEAQIKAKVQAEKIQTLGRQETRIEHEMAEMALKKKKAAMELDQSLEKGQAELELKKMDLEYRQMEADLKQSRQEREDAQDLKMLAEMDILEAKKQNDALDRKIREEKAALERQLALMREKARIDKERLEALSGLSPEQLISASDSDKAAMLADIAKTEVLKGLGADEVVAHKNPEAFKEALVERAKQSNNEKEKVMYERMLSMMEENTRNLTLSHQESADRADRIVDRLENLATESIRASSGQRADMDRMRQTESDKKEAIYEGSMDRLTGVEKARASSGAPGRGSDQVLICKTCRHPVDADANNCNNCGEKIY